MPKRTPHVVDAATKALTVKYQRWIGANVAGLRAAHDPGLTQEKLAAAIGREVTYVQKLEYGQVNPSVEVLVRLAKALGVSVTRLFHPARRTVQRGRPMKASGERRTKVSKRQ